MKHNLNSGISSYRYHTQLFIVKKIIRIFKQEKIQKLPMYDGRVVYQELWVADEKGPNLWAEQLVDLLARGLTFGPSPR